jgi:acyl carrier protein phosphodiesterase
MNFLAHTFLSPKNNIIMLGNLSGDFVKGKSMIGIHKDIKLGARLHREIDTFTDSHEKFKQAKRIVSPKFNHYSGVLIDMFFDYFLAKKWHNQNPFKLKEHIANVYSTGIDNVLILPEKFQPVLPIMIQHDWLSKYRTQEGLKVILEQMTNRINNKALLYRGVELLNKNEEQLEDLFNDFWLSITSEFETFPDTTLSI